MTLLWQYHTRTPIIASPTWTAESAAFPGRHYTVTVQADGRHFVIFPVGCFCASRSRSGGVGPVNSPAETPVILSPRRASRTPR